MVGNAGSILSPALKERLVAIQRSARAVDEVQLRLATGIKVNSALDNPQNFFAAQALEFRSEDLSRLLDGIGQSVRTIQEAEAGIEALTGLIDQSDAFAIQAKETILAQREDYSEIILEDDPVFYYRLNETSGNTAVNLGTAGSVLDATYNGGVVLDTGPLHLAENVTSARFDGVNDRVDIPSNDLINTDAAGYPERTIELTFEADDVNAGRQVLYEEGGTGNAIAIYVDGGRVYVTARDAGDFGPFNISAEIESGETYHVALTLDAPNALFTGYLDGDVIGTGVVTRPLSRHGAAVAIGRNRGGTFFHDGANGGSGEYFRGRIADVALYNDVLSAEDIQRRSNATLLVQARVFEQELQLILDQIDPLVEDANYRGINLLSDENLITSFNEERSSTLLTEGSDFSSSGLGFTELDFRTLAGFDDVLDQLDFALDEVRSFGRSLATDLSIIQIRETFTRETINTLQSGRDDLLVSDQNEDGANFLALQTRQQIQFSTLTARTASIVDFL